jgi:DNA-binding response OmpR family regulator
MALVVVVEDDVTTAALLCEALAFDGYDTACCADAGTALALVGAQPPALIVLDLWLGPLLCLDLVAGLRAHPATTTVPLLVLSADSRALQTHAAVLERHGCAVLTKPFDLAEFMAVVARLATRAV